MPAIATTTLTTRDLNRALLARQLLLSREKTAAARVIAHLVGMQAQVPRPPFVGLWTRVNSFTRRELLDALRQREVVRATSLRGTLHLMTASDFVNLRSAIRPALVRGLSVIGDRAKDADVKALEKLGRRFFGKAPATFDALRDHIKKAYPKDDIRALAYTIRIHVPLVQVPTDEPWGFPTPADFALAESWLSTTIPADESPPHELVRRYLAAFGPATPGDAQAWSALVGLRAVFEELRPTLVTFRDERKRELFDLPDAPRPAGDTVVPVRFLPEFDNALLSHDDRTRIIADAHRPRVFSKNLQVRSTFLVDGFVAGAWRVERRRKTATLVMEPFGTITKKMMAALEAEGDLLLRFVEEDAAEREVKWEKPS
jgi:hypothetical protein